MPFEVTTDAVTSFTFDITVVATGNNGKYILKPQIGESGARQEQGPLK
jgi:thioredoxin reductase